MEVKSTNLTKYLKTLMDLDILERRVPVTEENPEKSKRGLYKIKDNYLRFWFAFIYPNMSFIESGHSGIVMDKIRRGLTTSHIGFVYEDICQERMWELNVNNAWPFQFSKLGGYWDAKNEIDIAALDPEGKNLIWESASTGKSQLVLMSFMRWKLRPAMSHGSGIGEKCGTSCSASPASRMSYAIMPQHGTIFF